MNHSVENFTAQQYAVFSALAVVGVFSLGISSSVSATALTVVPSNELGSLVLLGVVTLLVVVGLLLIGRGVLDVPRTGPCGES